MRRYSTGVLDKMRALLRITASSDTVCGRRWTQEYISPKLMYAGRVNINEKYGNQPSLLIATVYKLERRMRNVEISIKGAVKHCECQLSTRTSLSLLHCPLHLPKQLTCKSPGIVYNVRLDGISRLAGVRLGGCGLVGHGFLRHRLRRACLGGLSAAGKFVFVEGLRTAGSAASGLFGASPGPIALCQRTVSRTFNSSTGPCRETRRTLIAPRFEDGRTSDTCWNDEVSYMKSIIPCRDVYATHSNSLQSSHRHLGMPWRKFVSCDIRRRSALRSLYTSGGV